MGDEPLVERALIERINSEPAIRAERVIIGGTAERPITHHHVIFDRMSHLVLHYRSFLRTVALAGTNVTNDPFAVNDDKFFALSLAARLGLSVPRTVLLPQKGYGHGVDPSRMLGNLEYPLKWNDVGHYAGFPAVLRSAVTGGIATQPVHDMGAVVGAFDHSWDRPTMLQAAVYSPLATLRCVCIGGERAVAVELDSQNGQHHAPDGAVGEALEAALKVSRALGLDLNAVEVVVTAAGAWVVDALDPVPHLAPHTLGAEPFDKVMDRLAEHLVDRARRPAHTIAAHGFAKAVHP